MAGIFPTRARMQTRLARLGYIEVETGDAEDWLVPGERARGHEFRYSVIDPMPETIRRVYRDPAEGYRVRSVLGSYVHLHFLSCPTSPKDSFAIAHGGASRNGKAIEHMTIRTTFLFLILTISGAVVCAESGASITGTVKDPQGQPVPGATLTLFSRTGAAGSATTSDSAGAYRFEGLPEGDYLLRAAAPGFALFLAEDIHLSAGAAETREVALQLAGVHEQVVVTASGTPQLPEQVSKATTVIDQADADARDAAALSDVVALAPGVRVQQLGGPGAFTTIQIRGLRDQDTAVLVDGLRLRDASATQADASGLIEDLLFTDANRVEVMRGSGSSLYGTNAIGGVINVITDEGGGRTRGSLLLEGGSLGAFRGRAQLAGGFRNDRIQYSLGVSETDVTSGVGGDAPFRNTSTQGRVTFHLSPSIRLIGASLRRRIPSARFSESRICSARRRAWELSMRSRFPRRWSRSTRAELRFRRSIPATRPSFPRPIIRIPRAPRALSPPRLS